MEEVLVMEGNPVMVDPKEVMVDHKEVMVEVDFKVVTEAKITDMDKE